MPPACMLEKREEERSLRAPSEKHLISGFGEDPGESHHDRDPAWTVEEKTQEHAEKPSNRAQKLWKLQHLVS